MYFFCISVLHLMMQLTWGHDLLFINLMNYCSKLFKNVKIKIKMLNIEIKQEKLSDQVFLKKLKSIVDLHRTAIHLAETLDDITNMMSFISFFINIFLVCFLIFNFSIVSCFL
jgi:hypothetical protein